MRYQYVQRESRYLFLPLFPAAFKENVSVFNLFFLELVISKFKYANLNLLNIYVKLRLIDKVLAKANFYRKQRFRREQ